MSFEEAEKARAAARPGLHTGQHESEISVEVFSARHRRAPGAGGSYAMGRHTEDTFQVFGGGAVQRRVKAAGDDRSSREQGKGTDPENDMLSKTQCPRAAVLKPRTSSLPQPNIP
ncbi:hypothetical protein SKAU_G00065400 [Synaphobranchus kaupii]|uniref:Uncharacterized protein n=1 Tax=Synaphobranchus kaupii TaxID=118154 RepID=A0A9Q1JB68_SYNKA|nr:hypothetical protein SKAU_G00065400 [Synaphobranchus kaupii]